MQFKKSMIAMVVGAAVAAPATVSAHDGQILNWAGSIYTKILDGSLLNNNGGYSVGGTYINAPDGGDQGQLTELELLVSGKITQQVEFGGRIKSRFNRNYWSNFGGFGPGDEVENPDRTLTAKNSDAVESAQYMKLRGVYVMVNPGYDWVDLVTIGSSDFNQFNPYTLGGLRYTDRDNASGFIAQGKFSDDVRWDFARISLPKLWAGPLWQTTATAKSDRGSYASDLFGNDAGYIFQTKFSSDSLSGEGQVLYVLDEEKGELNDDLTRESVVRYKNTVIGGALKYDSDAFTVKLTGYHSDFYIGDDFGLKLEEDGANPGALLVNRGSYIVDDDDPSARLQWSPTLMFSEKDALAKINLDINLDELDLVDDMTLAVEAFHIGAHYTSTLAARREKDILLTEGRDGAWLWRGAGERASGMGLGGWFGTMRGPGGFDGASQQVATLNVDNEFSDFDEIAAQSAIGWQGLTIAPNWEAGDWVFSGEYSYITYDNNWQAYDLCGDASNCLDLATSQGETIYPVMEGDANFGYANTYRAVYAPFQEKQTNIFVARASTTFDVGDGLDFWFKVKGVMETDERVTEDGVKEYMKASGEADFDTALGNIYDSVYALHGVGSGARTMTDVSHDDRDFTSWLIEPAVGYRLHEHLYTKFTWSHYDIDLIDGDVATSYQTKSFWKYYLTGKTVRDSLMLAVSYVVPGIEVGASINQIFNEYTPEFYYRGEKLQETDWNTYDAMSAEDQLKYLQPTETDNEGNVVLDEDGDIDNEGEKTKGVKTGIQGSSRVSGEVQKTRQYRMKTWIKVVF